MKSLHVSPLPGGLTIGKSHERSKLPSCIAIIQGRIASNGKSVDIEEKTGPIIPTM